MGPPLPSGKLAMWIFLATEIMFFTGLIGTYIVLRNGQAQQTWPTPEQVHLKEWIGAFNTFVLIASSLTVVLAHYALGNNNTRAAVGYVAITLALGSVFLVVKAYEYHAKWEHHILPGHVFDRVDGTRGVEYVATVKKDLEEILKHPGHAGGAEAECRRLLDDINASTSTAGKEGEAKGPLTAVAAISPVVVSQRVHDLLKDYHDLHLTAVIPFGNLWASCYFAMTGFHAIHVFGGLVIFVIILLMAALGRFGMQHMHLLEYTGLYWHFVDIVWIFLFPLLYLI
jgi:cytochrome c oxidase subunit 3